MAILKCKICGGELSNWENQTLVTCEYCGNPQTIKVKNKEYIENLFQRANALRLRCDFDKAEKLYERIIEEDPKNAEAYWGIILCRYGIVYVDDPKTGKRLPTCNRVSNEVIVADEDYKMALQYADVVQRNYYEMQAKEFDRIQKEILAISSKEEPFDVFICYKEKDEKGKRTYDSVIANQIYHELTKEGLKVFYAAITLEDKLGSAYEPIIFAALNSSKVMIVLGTKPEYFEAVWVKNEWNRYLALIKKGENKVLIPAFKDMDAYDLPEEFAHLQAQDMNAIAFMPDLIRGIKKILVNDGNEPINENLKNLEKRALMFLEDESWEEALSYADKILDIEPDYYIGYLIKLCVELRIHNIEEIKNNDIFSEEQIAKIETSKNYQRIIRYDNQNYEQKIKELIILNIYGSINKLQVEIEEDYSQKVKRYSQIVSLCSKIIDYQDVKEIKELYEKKINELKYHHALELMKKNTSSAYTEALAILKEISDCLDVNELILTCEQKKNDVIKQELIEKGIQDKKRKRKLKQMLRKERIKKIITITAITIFLIALITTPILCLVRYSRGIAHLEEGNLEKAYNNFSWSFGKEKNYFSEILSVLIDDDGILKDVDILFNNKYEEELPNSIVLNLYNNNKSYQNYTLDKNGYNNIGESYGLYDAYKDKFTLPKMYKFESVFAGWKVDGIQYYKKNHALVVNLSAQFIDDFVIIDNVLIEYNKMNEKMCTIPDGVVEISNGAFKQNKFKYLTIPSSVKNIGALAFEKCEQLVEVYYKGNIEQFNELNLSSYFPNTILENIDFYVLDENGSFRIINLN